MKPSVGQASVAGLTQARIIASTLGEELTLMGALSFVLAA